MGWGGIHLVIRGAEQVITRGVEAEPGHGALVGTDHLHTGGVGNGPDPDCGIGRSREHQLLHRDNTRRFTQEKFTSPRALPAEGSTRGGPCYPHLRDPGSKARARRTWEGWKTTLVTFLVWPLSVARICSELLSNTMTFLSAPPGKPLGWECGANQLQIHLPYVSCPPSNSQKHRE